MNEQPGTSDNTALARRFAHLWQRSCRPGSPDGPERPWHDLAERYVSGLRHYHGLNHIASCLEQFDGVRQLAIDPEAVEFALWYHDIIYEPGSSLNEQLSGEHFIGIAYDAMQREFVDRVARLIRTTTHREQSSDPDAQLLCDIDLWSLGADWERFEADSRALWAESRQPWEAHVRGKLRFFAALQERAQIYQTAHFRARFEQPARTNMQRLSAMLEAGTRFD